MKKYAPLIFLSFLCSYIAANEIPRMNIRLGYPRTMKSNDTGLFQISVQNNDEATLYDLELSVGEIDNLVINLDRTRISSLERNETVVVNMEVSNNKSYFSARDHVIVLKISNESFTRDSSLAITIEPLEFFWFFAVFSLMTVFAALLILICVKLNKGEI